jgi:hypothetical protein
LNKIATVSLLFLISLTTSALVRSWQVGADCVLAGFNNFALVKVLAHPAVLGVEPKPGVAVAEEGADGVDAVAVIAASGSAGNALVHVEAGALAELISVGAFASVAARAVATGAVGSARVGAAGAFVHVQANAAPVINRGLQFWTFEFLVMKFRDLNTNPPKQRQLYPGSKLMQSPLTQGFPR